MDNPVHHHVFIDGEWVDVYQIMAQARNSDAGEPESTPEPVAYTPEVGILSRTIFASPLFKFICPANIRHKDFTDVVLVGEDAIQLKQVHDYGHFRHVATKADFSGKILAARVFGGPRAATATASSPWPKKPTFHRARRSMTGDEDVDALPPEVLVLTLTSRTLMFLWAQHARTGSVSFTQKTLKLPFGRSRLDRFGSFLAIDHQHRAMAVAASEGGFILYKTKSMSQWREELQKGLDTTPISDERIISIEGRVQHMEFLSSGAGLDNHHVVLLFVVVYQGRTRLTCFDWDCREDISKAVARTERVLVDSDDNNPSLLIPLTRTSDFLLVLDTHISVYKDVLSGAPRRLPVPIDEGILTSLLPGDSRYRPCWVAWDKTVRNPGFPKEAFYVAREDGRIMYVERDAAGEVEIDEAGAWPYRIDTAFACLSIDNSEFSTSYPDVLIAGGNGNDGLVCKVGSWPAEYSYSASYPRANQLSFVESIPNWTPLTDMDIAQLPDSQIGFGVKRSSILTANGASPHGSISELRYGVQSLVEDSFGGISGCTGLWVIDYGSHTVDIEGKAARQHWVTFAVVLQPETLAIRIIRTQSESRGGYSGAWEDGSWDKCQLPNGDEPVADDLCRDEETLSACPWSENFAVQVTPSEARILTRPLLQLNHRLEFANKPLLAASQPGFPAVVVVYREAGLVYLEVFRVSNDGHFAPTTAETRVRHQLDNDPTCITLFYIEEYPCIFTSTFDSTIYFLALEGASVSLIHQESLLLKNRRVIIESAVVLSSKGQQNLLCGTRNGFLVNSTLDLSKPTQFNWSIVHVGDKAAQVKASSTDSSTAFVSCGSDFCRVRCPPTPGGALAIDSVWFTNRMNPGYLQAPVTAMYQLPSSQDNNTMERNLGGFLFAVSGDQLLFSQLESDQRRADDQDLSPSQNDCRTIPRTLFTGAKPTNILYLESYRKVAISTVEAKEQREPPNGYRTLESSIQLLNIYDEKPLDEPEVKQEFEEVLPNRLVSAKLDLKNGERVYSLIEWSFEDHRNKKYNLIIAGTGIPTASGKEKGRRIIISPGKTATKLQEQKSFDFDDPVYCAAIYRNNGIVSVIGKKLYLHTFDSEAGKMSMRANRELPSPGSHITVDDYYIQISTLQHSLLCFEVLQTGNETYSFMKVMTDSRERNCAHHLTIDIETPNATDTSGVSDDKIILVTDKRSSSVTGLHYSINPTQRNAGDTLFEACLPHTVVRLQVGDVRPLWRRPYSLVNSRSVIKDGIVGACSDGTIYNFAIIEQPGYHMLRYLQNIVEEKDRRDPAKRHTVVHARNGAIQDVLMNGTEGAQEELLRAHPLDPRNHDKTTAGPRNKHVDGDVLCRWRDEDGDLTKLVRDGAHADVGLQFFVFAKALWEGYIQSEEHAIDMTSQWLNEVLMPLL